MTAALGAGVGWLLLVALVLATGTVAGRWLILPRAAASGGAPAQWMHAAAARLGVWAAVLLPVALALFFVRQLAEFRDPFAPWTEDASLLLTGTSWGRVWIVGAIGSLLASASLLSARAGLRGAWVAAAVTVLPLGAFPAFTGHAAGEEELRALALAADTIHVWAAGGWIGGLATVLYVERAWRRGPSGGPPSLLPSLVPVFSPVALTCVAVLAGTGLFASWLHLPSLDALLSTRYGRTLGLKLLLVSAVLALGAVNWRRLTPRLGEVGGTDTLRRAATTELWIAQVVLLVTAVLVRTSPMDP